MAVSVTVRDWDTWPLAPFEDDRRLPLKLWYSDIQSVGDGTGGSNQITFNLAEGGDPAADGIASAGSGFGLITAGFSVTGGTTGRNFSLLIQGFHPLPGTITQDRIWGLNGTNDGISRLGVRPADIPTKIWLGHRIKNAPGLLILTVVNIDGETFQPSVFLCEWAPEAYVSGGPIWPAMAG